MGQGIQLVKKNSYALNLGSRKLLIREAVIFVMLHAD